MVLEASRFVGPRAGVVGVVKRGETEEIQKGGSKVRVIWKIQ